ncbi:2-succinyl-5-enolpyruvyl-6-hydroxy-3-cyclohexene-1-carboxylate synthase [Vibrio aerogenes CECT 7868]|uniref:2-succinyl-5-enolpyruvyl-6-hydroxy-3-cyclohexene-1-carboxylate synthase n=1 Tax=Vibrio aerogenes CECT 7868 TaxID=1216006 RepID=A0A1M5Y121_9VIBR|nr:2-succinyl-5-enolpyruvyl-6-hydroxy-3-cyclohexene-1-carboxylic-acid synthase [Vibrio aerogenes]SHI05223.1 2-succinyl-5-enolpyruvyl-6-hydroxy-3-cyclohexene-1-carboxylate synthase [Vibrio aerogenes CECT 7868]
MNRLWSRILLEELSRLGVTEVCLAPGSRSTPLTLEADDNPKLNLHTHFDERGLGYLALGLAKASQQPVVIIVTSGTAVANLLPAIAESRLTGEKLVVLTADRPVELIDCGANQAIEQRGIFSQHVTRFVDLPSPSASIPPGWLLTTVDQAMFGQKLSGGAIHFNCPFPEPLYSDSHPSSDNPYFASVQDWLSCASPYSSQAMPPEVMTATIDPEMLQLRGLVIIGSLDLASSYRAEQFAQQLGWPVLCDSQSGVGSDWAYYDVWLQHPLLAQKLSECEVVIQFGSRLVSRRLNDWLQQQVSGGCQYIYVSPDKHRDNQFHLPQQQVIADICQWADNMNRHLLPGSGAGWADHLLPVIRLIPPVIRQVAEQSEHLSETAVAATLAELTPKADLFIGNSLIVRLVDMFVRHQNRAVFSNRGASGIDGVIATATGVQRYRKKPLILLMGDTSFLYDINSMALLGQSDVPFVIVVLNNDGGVIFDLLPVPADRKTALYQMPHGYQFRHAAAQFGWAYQQPQKLTDYTRAIETHLNSSKGGLLIEVVTPPEQVAGHIRQIVRHVKTL